MASDHHLVVDKLKLKLKKNLTPPATKRVLYNKGSLRDIKIMEEFKIEIKNRFEVL